ncbi:histidine phosphatase family protein [Halobacillus salinarum]|uniref:Histidine phosphatase family protein n=1 Tax=Halobacillus salinarum TaxID=2932257 RepID=A0ABY4EER2_9BACI|nr:histidine phosphatase family protein [Halobacillus salinarum]UOQ42604.1 histidine phosphatase family protein [Halobacillus salinarum]
MYTSIYFVRHAHSIYTPEERERPLSVEGTIMAKKVADRLEQEEIDRIFSSPYRRAVQTIEDLGTRTGKEIMIEEDFKERKLAGKPVENFQDAVKKVWINEHFRWAGGESNVQAKKRGTKRLESLLEKFKGEKLVISTHGNLMVLMMNDFNPAFDYYFWEQLSMPDIYLCTFQGREMLSARRLWE